MSLNLIAVIFANVCIALIFFYSVLNYGKEFSFRQHIFSNEVIVDSKNVPIVQNSIRLNLADGKISKIEFRSLSLGDSGDKTVIDQYEEVEEKTLASLEKN